MIQPGFDSDVLLDHLLFSVRAKAKLEALEVRIADLKKLLGCVYVLSTVWVCYHVRGLQSLKDRKSVV